MDTGMLLGGIAAVNRFVEFAKTYVDRFNWSDETRALFLRVLAMLGGVLVALISGGRINVLEGIADVHPAVSTLVTGLTLGLGADFANAFLGLLYGWNNPPQPTVVQQFAPTSEKEEFKDTEYRMGDKRR